METIDAAKRSQLRSYANPKVMLMSLPQLLSKEASFNDANQDSESSSSPGDKSDLRERNRLAAQKWRQKKDRYLSELEDINDALRQQTLDVTNQALSLKVQNRLLEEELQYFQQFMSRVMASNPQP